MISHLAQQLAQNYQQPRTPIRNAEANLLIAALNQHGAAVLAHVLWSDGQQKCDASVIHNGEIVQQFQVRR